VTAIADSDASSSADAVASWPPFPFWLGVVTLTGTGLYALDGSPLSGAIILTPSAPQYIPGWEVLEGSATLTVVAGQAEAPIVVPCTDSVSPSFTYTISQRLSIPDNNPPPVTGVTIPRSLGRVVDISALL
jgi:hypothetical protein